MSDARRYHRRIRAAVETGDIGDAIERRAELRQQDWPIDELLEEFHEAVEDGNHEEAETVRHQLRERFAERRLAEKRAVERSARARHVNGLTDDDRQALTGHVETALKLGAARTSFLTTTMLYLTEPDEAEEDTVLDEIDELTDREREYDERSSTAESVSHTVAVPADVELIGGEIDGDAFAPDNPTTLAVRLANVGDDPARAVSVRVTPPDGAAVQPAERVIGELPGGEERTVEFTVTASDEGTHRFGVTAAGDTGGSSQLRLALRVDSEGERSPLLEAFSDGDGSIRFEDVVAAIAHFNDGDTVPGTDRTVEFQDVLWIIEEFNRAG